MSAALKLLAPETAVGETVPRIMTPPLVVGPPGPCGCGCALTPETSYGFGADDFARDTLLVPLDPWQRLAAIHAGELLPDGRPRFRRIVIVVARQNGKTHLLVVLTLYWMFLDVQPIILGTSTLTKYAAEPWQKAHAMALAVPDLEAELPPGRLRGMRKKASEEEWKTTGGARYLITPSDAQGGRSLTINRVIADELARQFTYDAYNAAYYAMRAVDDAQYFGLTTPVDHRSEVFNDFRKSALKFIETGEGDERLGLLEWSAPGAADPLDPQALAYANPNAGYRFRFEDLLNEAKDAVSTGGKKLTGFKAESMCITSTHEDPAIDTTAYAECLAELPRGFEDLRGKVALCFDVAPSQMHATLYAAAVQPDGRTRIGFVKEWQGRGCADAAGRELPALVKSIKPRAFGWVPGGPAAAVGAALATERPREWPPPGVTVEEIRSELTQVCMGFAVLVDARQLARSATPLLDDQVGTAEKLPRGDAWVYTRKGADADALYAAAGASYLARTLQAGKGNIRVLIPTAR
jgi:hypothetical protein